MAFKIIKHIGWILWKLNLAIKVVDEIEELNSVNVDKNTVTLSYIEKEWHYILK